MDGDHVGETVPHRAINWSVLTHGFVAFQRGRSVRDCPYGRDRPDFRDWVRGYWRACVFARRRQAADPTIPQKFHVKPVGGRADWHPAEAAFLCLAWTCAALRTVDIAGALGRPVQGVRGKAARLGLGGRPS